jgi:tetratricopeptide (TPR) repeat protein
MLAKIIQAVRRPSLKSPGVFPWSVAACVCLAIAGVFLLVRRHRASGLPEYVHSTSLPPQFDQALKDRRENVRRGGYSAEGLRALAHLYEANWLYDEASACYQRIGATPAQLTARDHYYLADIAANRGDLERAASELKSVEEGDPGYLPARLARAEVLFKSGHADEAASEYSALLAAEPNQPQALFGMARIELLGGHDDAAVARLRGLMASHPEMTSGAALLAQIFERRGEKEAAAAMTLWSRQPPGPVPPDPWMDALLVDCYDLQRLGLKFEEYFASGQIAQAVPLLGRLEELDPKSPIPQLLRGWTQARDHHDLEAVQEYRKALDKGGDPEKIGPYIVQSMIALGKVDEALTLMAEFYREKPESIPIVTTYADVAMSQGDLKRARVLLAKLVQIDPYSRPGNLRLAKILWESGERDEAAKCLERLAEVSPNDVASRALLGEYFLGKSQPLPAITVLEQAVKVGDQHAPYFKNLSSMLYAAYLQAGDTESGAGRFSEAVKHDYDKAIQILPSNPAAYARKAVACAQAKQFPEAAEALEVLGSLQPKNPTIFLSLGDVVYQEGRVDEARSYWQKAMGLAGTENAGLRGAIGDRLSGNITADTFK